MSNVPEDKNYDEGNVLRLVEKFKAMSSMQGVYAYPKERKKAMREMTRHSEYSPEDVKEVEKRISGREFSNEYISILLEK